MAYQDPHLMAQVEEATTPMDLHPQWQLPPVEKKRSRFAKFALSASPRVYGWIAGGLLFLGGCAWYGTLVYDTQSGGALGQEAVDATVDAIVAASDEVELPDEESLQWVVEHMDDVQDDLSWLRLDSATLLEMNAQVRVAISNHGNDIDAIQDAAIESQILHIRRHLTMYTIRLLALERTHPDLTDDQRNRLSTSGLVDDITEYTNNLHVLRDRSELHVSPVRFGEYLEDHPELFESELMPTSFREGLMLLYPQLAPPVETEWEVVGPIIVEAANGYEGSDRIYPIRNLCVAEQIAFEFFDGTETFWQKPIREAQHEVFQDWCVGAKAREKSLTIGVTFEQSSLPPMPAIGAHYSLQQHFSEMGDDMGEEVITLPAPDEPANPSSVSEFRERARGVTGNLRERASQTQLPEISASEAVWCAGVAFFRGEAAGGRCTLQAGRN